MKGTLTSWAILTAAIATAAWAFDGVQVTGGFWGYVWVAAVLGLVNTLVKPLLILFTLPLTILTFGIFLIVINAISLSIVTWLSSSITIDTFGTTLLAAVLISIVSWFLNSIVADF